jgi:hypothetical protein
VRRRRRRRWWRRKSEWWRVVVGRCWVRNGKEERENKNKIK